MGVKEVVLKPRLSEKTYGLSQSGRIYIFDVPFGANKHSVAKAVEAQFDVSVLRVNIANLPGKNKRTVSLSGRRSVNRNGQRVNICKAYVTLKEGDSLPIFAAVEEAEKKQAETQEKVTKSLEKQTAKEEAKTTRRGLHLPGHRGGARGGDK